MALGAVGVQVIGLVVGVGRGVVVILVAADAGVGRVVVVPVVAVGTLVGDGGVGSVEGVVVVVYVETGRAPSRIGGVAVVAIGRQIELRVAWVGGGVVVVLVATDASGGCVDVIGVMAVEALGGDRGVGPGEGVVLVVDGESCRAPAGIGGVAVVAGRREI